MGRSHPDTGRTAPHGARTGGGPPELGLEPVATGRAVLPLRAGHDTAVSRTSREDQAVKVNKDKAKQAFWDAFWNITSCVIGVLLGVLLALFIYGRP